MPTPIPENDIGRGLDQFHPESRIPEGYALDLENVEPTNAGTVKKRAGWERFGGGIPLRVRSISRSGTTLRLVFDDWVDCSLIRSTPIVVYGKRGEAGTGYFSTTDNSAYFTSFTPPGSTAAYIEVTDSASGAISSTTDVQLSVWGIPVADVVSASAGARAGWVTGLATYKSSTAEHLVAVMGGVLHAALPSPSVTYRYPTSKYVRLLASPSGTTTVGRAFYDVAPTTSPTRGYILADSAPGGLLRVSSASYDSGTSHTTFVLEAPGYSVSTALATVLRADVDWLTVSGMGDSLDGEHLIKSVSYASEQVTIECDVTANAAADKQRSEAEAYGRAGVFSDRVTTSTGGNWLYGDRITSVEVPYVDYALYVLSGTDTTVVLGGVEDPVAISSALYGTRTSNVIPLGNGSYAANSDNFVKGDVVSLTGYSRRFVVKNVWSALNDSVDITSDGVTATVTNVTSTSGLSVGDLVLLVNSTSFNGVVEVASIASSTSFTFDSTEIVSVAEAARIVGNTIAIDEAVEWVEDYPIASATAVSVDYRWIPREAPATAASDVPATYSRYFDVAEEDDCDYVSTAMLGENLYLANGRDEVLKYDGENLYRAGLPSWPFAISGTIRTSDTPITNPTAGVASSAHTNGTRAFTIASGDEDFFDVGDYVEIVDGGGYLAGAVLRTAVAKLAAGDVRTVDASVSGGSLAGANTIYKQMTFRYYFRAVYTDANNNRIPGPGIRSRDFVFRVGTSSEVQFLVSCFPPVDNYPWDRLELEIYRTAGTAGSPPFVRIGTLAFPFDSTRTYIYFRDVVQPDASLDSDLTAVLTSGASVGAGWREPPIAKYAASVANRLCLASIRSNQRMEVTIRRKNGVASLPAAACPAFSVSRIYGSSLFGTSNITAQVHADPVYYNGISNGDISVTPRLYQYDADTFALDLSADPTSNISAGTWVYLNHINQLGENEDRGTPYCGWYQVRASLGGNVYTIAAPQPYSAACRIVRWVTATDHFEWFTDVGMTTGDAVYLRRVGGGVVPAGLSEWTTYYARIIGGGGGFYLHTTQADAISGTNTITSATADTTWLSGEMYVYYGDVDAYPTHACFAPNRLTAVSSFVPVYLTGVDSGGLSVGERKDFLYADVPKGDVTTPATETYEAYLCRRYADAINCAMRAVDRSLYSTFRPWILADAGSDVGYGILRLESPTATETAFGAGTTTTVGGWEMLVDGVLHDYTETTGAESSRVVFPSRIVRSYPNYPELFDSPFAANALLDSDSAIDVNPNDGDEIVAIRPFFGESFSSGSSGSAREQMLLVEKRRAKYAVNVETREVQLIETNETGTDFVRSTAPTKGGIASATSEGVFAVDRSLSLRYIGEFISRLWKKRVNRDATEDVPVGYHEAADRKYLLAVPVLDADDTEVNTEVLAYDYTRDSGAGDPSTGSGYGAWARWTGFEPSTFARHSGRTYYGSYAGRVYRRRACGDSTDYRDDAAAISSVIELRPTSFGAPGLRKTISAVQLEFRVQSDVSGIRVSVATDLGREYLSADSVTLRYVEPTTGVGDVEPQATWSVQYSLPAPKAEFVSLRIESDTLDEGFELCGVTWMVDAGGTAGVLQAART